MIDQKSLCVPRSVREVEQAINLSAASSRGEMLAHLLDSLHVVPHGRVRERLARSRPAPRGRVLDVGSGGGFPVVVAAISSARIQFTSLEPVHKKHAFHARPPRASSRSPNLDPLAERLEDHPARDYDAAMSRATFDLRDWLEAGRERVVEGGIVLGFEAVRRGDLPATVERFRVHDRRQAANNRVASALSHAARTIVLGPSLPATGQSVLRPEPAGDRTIVLRPEPAGDRSNALLRRRACRRRTVPCSSSSQPATGRTRSFGAEPAGDRTSVFLGAEPAGDHRYRRARSLSARADRAGELFSCSRSGRRKRSFFDHLLADIEDRGLPRALADELFELLASRSAEALLRLDHRLSSRTAAFRDRKRMPCPARASATGASGLRRCCSRAGRRNSRSSTFRHRRPRPSATGSGYRARARALPARASAGELFELSRSGRRKRCFASTICFQRSKTSRLRDRSGKRSKWETTRGQVLVARDPVVGAGAGLVDPACGEERLEVLEQRSIGQRQLEAEVQRELLRRPAVRERPARLRPGRSHTRARVFHVKMSPPGHSTSGMFRGNIFPWNVTGTAA